MVHFLLACVGKSALAGVVTLTPLDPDPVRLTATRRIERSPAIFVGHSQGAAHSKQRAGNEVSMLRLTWQASPLPPRVLSQDELIRELEEMAARAFAGASPGAVSIEALDEGSRVTWSAYYKSAAELATLLRQLLAEREIASRGRG
jgi:malonyl CoA-acyl carrier protein transacylase